MEEGWFILARGDIAGGTGRNRGRESIPGALGQSMNDSTWRCQVYSPGVHVTSHGASQTCGCSLIPQIFIQSLLHSWGFLGPGGTAMSCPRGAQRLLGWAWQAALGALSRDNVRRGG